MSEVRQPATGVTQTDQDNWLSGYMHQTLYVVLRGLLATVPGFALEKVLMLFCMTSARLIAEVYAGDELAVRRLRKGCVDIFTDTLKAMPVVPLNAPMPTKAETAAING